MTDQPDGLRAERCGFTQAFLDRGAESVFAIEPFPPNVAALRERFAAEPRVRVLGFTDAMGELLAAADVLLHSTAGLTVFEARIRGARVISYGWGRAHIRVNNAAYRRLGLAQVVDREAQLAPALRRAFAQPRVPLTEYGERPTAAAEVLKLIDAGVS